MNTYQQALNLGPDCAMSGKQHGRTCADSDVSRLAVIAAKRSGMTPSQWRASATRAVLFGAAFSAAHDIVDSLIRKDMLDIARGRRMDLIFDVAAVLGSPRLSRASVSEMSRAVANLLERSECVAEVYGTQAQTVRRVRELIDAAMASAVDAHAATADWPRAAKRNRKCVCGNVCAMTRTDGESVWSDLCGGDDCMCGVDKAAGQ